MPEPSGGGAVSTAVVPSVQPGHRRSGRDAVGQAEAAFAVLDEPDVEVVDVPPPDEPPLDGVVVDVPVGEESLPEPDPAEAALPPTDAPALTGSFVVRPPLPPVRASLR